jgi:arsenate reductase (thioredoxin)
MATSARVTGKLSVDRSLGGSLPIAVRWSRAMKTILFACIHNAGRSQMAAGWFNQLADRSKAQAVSAGTEPGTRVHPEVLEAMKEVGVDLSDAQPQLLSDDLVATAAMLVTMGCGEASSVVPGVRRDDWPLEDPKGKPLERVRQIREDVRERVLALIEREGWSAAT